MKRLLTWLLVVGALLPAAAQQITEQDKERAAALVERMTLDEKLDYIGGFNSFYIRAIPRLGIPQIRMADGPQGVRNDTRSTMFPCGIAAAAAWDRSLRADPVAKIRLSRVQCKFICFCRAEQLCRRGSGSRCVRRRCLPV